MELAFPKGRRLDGKHAGAGPRSGKWHHAGMRLLPAFLALSIPFLLACEGPTAVFPGGELAGPFQPAPASFDFARYAGTVQLETRPEDPYSVNIACAVVGDALFVSAGDNKSRWVENIEANPLVRLRIAGETSRSVPSA
jgi:hypothetical protein